MSIETPELDDAVEFDRDEYLTGLRGLVESGGLPYIKITVVNPETGEFGIEHFGLGADVNLVGAFREIADAIEAAA